MLVSYLLRKRKKVQDLLQVNLIKLTERKKFRYS